MQYYLSFKINKIPDLSMIKYSVYDISGQEDLLEKHEVFLRQLHRLGVESNVYFHLLYYYDGREDVDKGKRLQICFYATSADPSKLELIREFVTTSVLSTYYDFYCYEISNDMPCELSDEGYLRFINVSGTKRQYKISGDISVKEYNYIRKVINSDGYMYCEVDPNTNEVTAINSEDFYVDNWGRIVCGDVFNNCAYLTKKDYHLYAQNRLYNDPQNVLIPIYSIMELIPNETGRLYNVLKLMEGYNVTAAIRIDLFPTDMAESFNDNMTVIVNELRQRMAQHEQGRDDNCDTVLKSIDSMSKKMMKYPQFIANIVAFADYKDIAIMLADSIGAESIESGSYFVKELSSDEGFDVYSNDDRLIVDESAYNDTQNYMLDYVSLYTLDEIRPMFSFPVLYQGESIECMKETDPEFETESGKTLYFGQSESGYSVNFPIKLFKKHAFISGVPGAGKTTTLLYMVSELWNRYHIPFLVLEPAKQEYRTLAKTSKLAGMEFLKEICIFSPGADTRFPLHINPFEFPIGLTLAEHIANLNAVFAGAFELPPPSPHFIDTCIEQVYVNKGWNVNSRNTGELPYPTMQELYDSLYVAVQNSHYEGETLGNLRSVMEVRVGSLLKREIGSVYNVEFSSFRPEEWIDRPVIIELEALGEGPANFMALLISTLIRETLKVRKTQAKRLVHYNKSLGKLKIHLDSGLVIDENVDEKIVSFMYDEYDSYDTSVNDFWVRWGGYNVKNTDSELQKFFDYVDCENLIASYKQGVCKSSYSFVSQSAQNVQINMEIKFDTTKNIHIAECLITDETDYGVNHIIFYEEAHNLVGPTQDNIGDKVDPKVSATKFLVKMLAEVRALNEGIVIADQLPTVMAPEVLKNTGLKIGHRITASDDRELLGSTMAATADQLAEQSLYLPGEALVFYEGLQKPFKMRMVNWQKSKSEYKHLATEELYSFLSQYYDGENWDKDKMIEEYFKYVTDSPTDDELFSLIKHYPVYKEMLENSMAIILQRVLTSYKAQYEQVAKLNESKFAKMHEEGTKLTTEINKLKKQYHSGTGKRTEIAEKINKFNADFKSPVSVFTGFSYFDVKKKITVSDQLKNILTECNNLLYNNMAIIHNYNEHAPQMCVKIIEAYLHIFECVDYQFVWDDNVLDVILSSTEQTRKYISMFVDLDDYRVCEELNMYTEHLDGYRALFERGSRIQIIKMVSEFEKVKKELFSCYDWENGKINTENLKATISLYNEKYFYWLNVAMKYEEHQKEIISVLIRKYMQIFDSFDFINDIQEYSHQIYELVKPIREDVKNYVCWKKDTSSGALYGIEEYEELVCMCHNFVRLEMHEIFYQMKKSKLDGISVNDIWADDRLIGIISRAIIDAYYNSFNVCVVTGERTLVAECIDLFYDSMCNFGSMLTGAYKAAFDKNIKHTCERIRIDTITPLFGNTTREKWKMADVYWQNSEVK